MPTSYVIILADVYCSWIGEPPRYRLYVNNELLTERVYIWHQEYLEEMIPFWVNPGNYNIRYELITDNNAELSIRNLRIVDGPDGAKIHDNQVNIPA